MQASISGWLSRQAWISQNQRAGAEFTRVPRIRHTHHTSAPISGSTNTECRKLRCQVISITGSSVNRGSSSTSRSGKVLSAAPARMAARR
ncbi:hypothetical protein QE386_000044 [Pseudoxanthomonas winnipegensis]|nr:hypothetical protein [Pseudoxanthomonas winnipegensis]